VAHEKDIVDIVFSSDGRYLATESEDKTVQVWQVNSGSEVRCFPQESDVLAVALSPTGKYLAVVEENLTHVWQISSMQEIICLEYERCISTAVAFSPDENYLAVGSYDGTVEVWQIGSWCKVASMTHDRDVIDIGKSVESVAFSPDGKYLATASADHTARVWDIASKREVARMTHKDCVWAVDFSPGGTYIATRSSGTARVWLWKPEDLIAEACSRLTRNLYEEEWQQYLGDEPYHNTCPHLP
jgi:WD40 repeat protein